MGNKDDKKSDPARPAEDTKRKNSGTEREAIERWDQKHAPK